MAEDEYNRGHAAGSIAERLAGHDKHFAAINGSLERLASQEEIHTLKLQRIQDAIQSSSDRLTRILAVIGVATGLALVGISVIALVK